MAQVPSILLSFCRCSANLGP